MMDNSNNMFNDLYFRYINTKINEDLFLLTFGHEKCSKGKISNGPQQKDHFILHYVLSGEGEFIYNDVKYSIGADKAFYIAPSTTYYYIQNEKNPWEYIWLEFSGSNAKQLCEEALFSLENPVYYCINKKIREDLIELLDCPKNLLSLELFSLSHLLKFIALIIDERRQDNLNILSNKQKLIANVQKIIINNYSNSELHLKDISNELYMNASYLSRIFKEETGLTLRKYIISIRMQRACELLENKVYSIKDIIFMVGYTDTHYFTTEFKKHIGISPSKFISIGLIKKYNLP